MATVDLRESVQHLPDQLRDIAVTAADLNDLPAIARAGVSACPSDARPEIRARVDLVLEAPGGHGAVREMCDLS